MPIEIEYKQKIDRAIRGFTQQRLAASAISLFDSLGYQSQKRLSLQPNTAEQFCAEFDSEGELKEKALVSDWKQVEFLFQITDDEINTALGQGSLFASKQVDNTIINSYLFFAIQLNNEHYTRTQLADITREVNKLFSMPVMVLFLHGKHLTLSIIARRLNKRDASKKDVLEKVTLIRNISISNPHRAHIEILLDLSIRQLNSKYRFMNFVELQQAWENVLNTSKLNSDFYAELSAWYYWAISTIKLPVIANYIQDKNNAEKENVKNFTVRLICRTIFCWFLKERGLINPQLLEIVSPTGSPVILTRVSDANNFKNENSYYRGILQNIFFECLNRPMNERRKSSQEAYYDKTVENKKLKKLAYRGKSYLPDNFDYSLFDEIPYLNGGLFDILQEDNASDIIDDKKIYIPNKLFYSDAEPIKIGNKLIKVKGLNRILSSYVFTISENTPLEEEIALDPELLGLVFENLLAEIDPDETVAKNARKASGSYYTPRKIIEYMVNESLRLYLGNYIPAHSIESRDISIVNDLLYYGKFDTNNESLADSIVQAFDNIKILDPACGSGAFPMGILQRIITLLKIVDPENKRWLHYQLSHIPDSNLRENAEKELLSHTDNYSRKIGLIRNCIYGIDNQPLAILISKLRFFISLLVDQKIDINDSAHNYHITPLPNLETKLLCADSLRDLQPDVFAHQILGEIKTTRESYYQPDITSQERQVLADGIAEKMAQIFQDFGKRVSGTNYNDFKLREIKNIEYLKEWFQHATICAPFFNLEAFFPELENSGFDIVIGNPPYGGTDIPEDVRQNLSLESKDPYGAFIARFLGDGRRKSPLKDNGILSFIVSDTFMTIKTHCSLRRQILSNKVHKMIRVHQDTFRATVNTVIILCEKMNNYPKSQPSEIRLLDHHCQMVDMSNISIHENYDKFLEILYKTKGFDYKENVSTKEFAIFDFPQNLIENNSNLPFFIASPKFFNFVNDGNSQSRYISIKSKQVNVRSITINDYQLSFFKLGQIAEVPQGISTGQNKYYLRRYEEGEGYQKVDESLIITPEEIKNFSQKEKFYGIRSVGKKCGAINLYSAGNNEGAGIPMVAALQASAR